MKKIKTLLVALMSTFLLCSCPPDDHGVIINGRTNADVSFINERTNEKWHGSSDEIEQKASFNVGVSDEDNTFDLTAQEGDVIRINYSPYPHFAEKHSVTMTTLFDGISTATVVGAPYETKLTMDASASTGIHTLTVIGISGKDGDECYLNERRTIKVKVE